MLITNVLREGRFLLIVGMSTVCVMMLAVPARALELKTLVDRLERLERDIRTLNIQISRGHDAVSAKVPLSVGVSEDLPNAGIARLTARLDNLEQDIRSVTGSLEQLGHGIHQLTGRLDRLVSDIDFRLSSFEEKLGDGSAKFVPGPITSDGDVKSSNLSAANFGGGSGASVSVPSMEQSLVEPGEVQNSLGTVSSKAVKAVNSRSTLTTKNSMQGNSKSLPQRKPAQVMLPAGKPKEQYTYALNLLRQTKYDEAEVALTQFIAMQAEHPLAGNARYWLGETYYVQEDYEQAAQTFFSSYRKNPTNLKAPDMLLKLGMSLFHLKKPKEACATFEKLTKDFPRASTRINNAVARERKRASC